MHSVHPVFHVSQLEPATPNTIPNCIQPPPLPVEVNGEPEYEISKILDSKLDWWRRQCQLLYLIQWSGYEGTDKETSWLLAMELRNASELVSDYHSAYLDKPGPIQLWSIQIVHNSEGVRLDYRDEKAVLGMGKLCSKTWARGIYSTCRTATERENLRICARDSLATREGAQRCREWKRCRSLWMRIRDKIQSYIWYF
jgi:hypothetical protein